MDRQLASRVQLVDGRIADAEPARDLGHRKAGRRLALEHPEYRPSDAAKGRTTARKQSKRASSLAAGEREMRLSSALFDQLDAHHGRRALAGPAHQSIYDGPMRSLPLCLLLAACNGFGFGDQSCPQPREPVCRSRTAAWCGRAGVLFTPGTLPDAGIPVRCESSAVNEAYAFFDAGVLDDAGVPVGCPASLSPSPNDMSTTLIDGGVLSDECCYRMHVYCA